MSRYAEFWLRYVMSKMPKKDQDKVLNWLVIAAIIGVGLFYVLSN